jgi:hypothetical protein
MRTGIAPDETCCGRMGPRGRRSGGTSTVVVRRRGTAAVPAGGGEPGVAELLVRRQGVLPIASVEDLAAVDDAFESDEEFEAFLPTRMPPGAGLR